MGSEGDKGSYVVNGRGLKMYCRYWEPPKGKPKAIVFISHGFAEHSEYYVTFAERLASIGCFVFAHDHVGHGRSEGPRVLIEDLNHYVDDVFQHVDLIKKKFPDIPAFYYGNSMGGAIGATAAMRRPNYFKGMMLSGAAVSVRSDAAGPLVKKLCGLLGWLVPSLPVVQLDYTFITRSDEILQKRKKDPLNWIGRAKAGWIYAMLKGIENIQKNSNKIECGLLILHGEDDLICDVEGSKMLYDKCSSTDKTLKLYPKAYHNILEEPDGIKEKAEEDIVKWMEKRI